MGEEKLPVFPKTAKIQVTLEYYKERGRENLLAYVLGVIRATQALREK